MEQFNLVLIASAICTTHLPLDYTPTRSFFSHTQRYEQSLETIDKIKEKIPNPYIVFIEGTSIPDSMKEVLIQKLNYFFDASKIEWVHNHVNSPHKSRGEIASILSYLLSDHFKEHKHTFISLSKISGRYKPERDFNFIVIPNAIRAKVEYQPKYHACEYMSTMFYTVPNSLLDIFVKICDDCYNDSELINGKPIECILLKSITHNNVPVYRTALLNVGGEYGPWGGYVMH